MTASAEVFHALIERRQWKTACMHLQSNQSDASIAQAGLLPLHKACEANAPHVVIRALLQAYSDAAKVKGENGLLPLHYVCQKSYACDKAVTSLLGANATAASTPDNQQMLPLHIACKFGASAEVIDIILAAHPEGMHVQDIDNNYPLDYVTSSKHKNKLAIFKALDHANIYCNISKAATTRTAERYESKVRKIESEHATTIAKIKKQYEEEKDKARSLEDLLNKSDVQHERMKVEKLTQQIDKMKTSFDTERAESKKDNEELQVHLEAARKNFKKVTVELDESKNKIEHLTDIERNLNEKVIDLQGEFESTMLKLQEASTERDGSKERIKNLETRLSEAIAQNAAYKDQNQMMKDMLRDMSTNVQTMILEQATVKEMMAARSNELHSIVASHDALLERTTTQKDTMLRTKIDLDNIVRFVNMEEESNNDDCHTADTKSTASTSSTDVPARINVPLEEKALGSLVLKELQ